MSRFRRQQPQPIEFAYVTVSVGGGAPLVRYEPLAGRDVRRTLDQARCLAALGSTAQYVSLAAGTGRGPLLRDLVRDLGDTVSVADDADTWQAVRCIPEDLTDGCVPGWLAGHLLVLPDSTPMSVWEVGAASGSDLSDFLRVCTGALRQNAFQTMADEVSCVILLRALRLMHTALTAEGTTLIPTNPDAAVQLAASSYKIAVNLLASEIEETARQVGHQPLPPGRNVTAPTRVARPMPSPPPLPPPPGYVLRSSPPLPPPGYVLRQSPPPPPPGYVLRSRQSALPRVADGSRPMPTPLPLPPPPPPPRPAPTSHAPAHPSWTAPPSPPYSGPGSRARRGPSSLVLGLGIGALLGVVVAIGGLVKAQGGNPTTLLLGAALDWTVATLFWGLVASGIIAAARWIIRVLSHPQRS